MGMPRTLKNLMLFNEGDAYLGEIKSITLPTLTRKTDDWRGGGMSGSVAVDQGMDKMEMTSTFGGPMRDILRQWGITTVDGVYLRAVGAYQQEDTGDVDTIEIVVRGRHTEIEPGDSSVGEAGDFKVKTAVAYYKLIWNGVVEIEIDPLNMIEIVGGVDRQAAIRSALGI